MEQYHLSPTCFHGIHRDGCIFTLPYSEFTAINFTCSLQHFVFLYRDFMLHLQNKGPNCCNHKKTVRIVRNSQMLAVNYIWSIKFRYAENDLCKERTGWQNCAISEYLLWYPVHITEVWHGFVFLFFIILLSKSNCVCTLIDSCSSIFTTEFVQHGRYI